MAGDCPASAGDEICGGVAHGQSMCLPACRVPDVHRPRDSWLLFFDFSVLFKGDKSFHCDLGTLEDNAMLTSDMRAVIRAAHLCFAATVTPDGQPNLSPKGPSASGTR